jgi:hypothetical protein
MKEVEARLPSTFTTRVAREFGVHPRDLYSWRDDGRIIELSRGVFRRAEAAPATFPDLLAVAHRVPLAVVCCVSAAAAHDLTDELVSAVQIAVPNSSAAPRIDFPPVTSFRFDQATFELGLSRLEAAPREWVRIYSPTRTVVDLMRLRSRLGEPLAYAALNRYLRSRAAKPGLLLEFASKLGVYGPVRQALDISTAG